MVYDTALLESQYVPGGYSKRMTYQEYLTKAKQGLLGNADKPQEVAPPPPTPPEGALPGVAVGSEGLRGAFAAPQEVAPPPPIPVVPALPATSREKTRADFMAALQPQMTAATNQVTSAVNPYMTGKTGASLLRDVQAPALQALSQFELEQPEKEKTTARDLVATLGQLIAQGNATADTKAQYNAALTKLITLSGGVAPSAGIVAGPGTGTTTGTGGQFVSDINTGAIQAQIDALSKAYPNMASAPEGTKGQYNQLMNQVMGTTGQNYISPETPQSKQETTESKYGLQLKQAEATLKGMADQISRISTWVRSSEGMLSQMKEPMRDKWDQIISKVRKTSAIAESGAATDAQYQEFFAAMKELTDFPA